MAMWHSLHASYIYLILLCVPNLAQAGTICFDCQQIDDPASCKAFKTCDDGEECFHETLESEDGSPKYSWGCASPQLCALEANLSTRRKRLGVQKCFGCCDSNFCNYGGCLKDFCASVTCRNNATCSNSPLRHVCNCASGYTGEFCEAEIDECASSPCQNGATCTDFIGYYTCTCLPGYTGDNCQIDIDECASSPCLNGATCVDGVNGFTCDCVPGFTDTLCDLDIDECASSPCQYNSTCQDLVNGYACDCIPGTTGSSCEINIDECENVICYNGGTCQDQINGFVCLCDFGFSGSFCRSSLGRVCYSCETGIDDPSNCTKKVICGQGEECYMEHELVSVGVETYNLGCVARGMCSVLGQSKARRNKPIQLCYECCDVNGCNFHACAYSRVNRLWTL